MRKMVRKTVCQACKGRGKTFVFYNTGLDSSKHYSNYETCSMCYGKVAVSVEDANKLRKRLTSIDKIRRKMGVI